MDNNWGRRVNMPLPATDQTSRKKIKIRNIENLKNNINKLDLVEIHKTLLNTIT